MKLKTISISILFLCMSTIAFSQQKVDASDIIKDLKNGKNIRYKNATIVGTLDFTFMNEASKKLPRRRWRINMGDNTIKHEITSRVIFDNCVFESSVFAYIHDEESGYTFTANFDNDVIFKNCHFQEMALFKYSTFRGACDFSGSRFHSETTFKYAIFRALANFSESTFRESATFKYSKFNRGVLFTNSKFEEDLNLKYTKVRGKFDIKGLSVASDMDTKYTSINGKRFRFY